MKIKIKKERNLNIFYFTFVTVIFLLNFNYLSKGSCFNVHKFFEVTNLYGRTINFKKNKIFEKGNVEVYNDFVFVNNSDSGILKEIEKGNVLSELKEMLGMDTLENMYRRQKGIPIRELISIQKKEPLPSTFFFHASYKNTYIVFAEVKFLDEFWNNGDALKEVENSEYYGFEISGLYSKVSLYTFKCDEKGELIHLRTDTYATFH